MALLLRKRSSPWLAAVALSAAALAGCSSPTKYYSEGVAHLNHSPPRYQEAVEAFTSVLEALPDSELAYANRGDAYLGLEQRQKAIEDYSQAIARMKEAGNPWFYNKRGLVYYEMGDHANALADWKRARDLEDQLRKLGYKVKTSEDYMAMLDLREQLLVEVERGATTIPSTAGAGTTEIARGPEPTEPAATEPAATEPGTEPVVAMTEPGASEPAATEPAATEPAATEPAATSEADAIAAAHAASEEEALRREAAALEGSGTDATEPAATEPAATAGPVVEGPFEATDAHREKIDEARALHDLARMEAEAAAAAAAAEPVVTEPATTEPASTEPAATEPVVMEPAATEPATTEPAVTEPVVMEPATTEPAATEPAATEPAVTEAEPAVTEEHMAAIASMRALHEARAAEAAAERERAAAEAAAWSSGVAGADRADTAAARKRAADLTGTWTQEDGTRFRLLDDGTKVVGEIADSTYYVFYEVTLEWQSETELVGRGVFKEKLTACGFEASVGWKLTVKDGNTLAGSLQEVGWLEEDCQENYRDWVEYSFTRQE